MRRFDVSRGVVLALGSGGVRGLAHLGFLAELEKEGVEVRAIAGTSSGALMGALWLLNGAEPAIQKVRAFMVSGLVEDVPDLEGTADHGSGPAIWRRLRRAGTLIRAVLAGPLLSREQLFERVAFFLPETPIEALPRPFVVVATDSATGEEVRLTRGSLRLAVTASSAMPGLVSPIVWAGRPIQDGGAVAEIPVRAARALGSPVVAVEVSEATQPLARGGDRVPTALFRAAAMGWAELRRRLLEEADAVVAPAVNHLHWGEYRALDEAVEAGRVAARRFLAGDTPG
jgi:NTE family protein